VEADLGSFTGIGLQVELAVQMSRPLTQSAQAKANLNDFWLEATTIVLNQQSHRVIFQSQFQPHLPGVGVSLDIS
jgi:hypothetical protein